ncbi:hypothetical protein FIV46_11030 [Emcibacter nanhaiensis]|uniref:asparagine synthase (glutamine-hydrolyzing) n=2 Tax=Emcibacter nanhaiensis TaxID=1505037 RepID=A0A501PH08_9PROT|nr:hypothetical protein FIV46_11030 [Emcibacter nanhaiensis]
MTRKSKHDYYRHYHLSDPSGPAKGVILGRLFSKCQNSEENASKEEAPLISLSRLLETEGKSLTDNYWGNYIAFISRGSNNYVQLDPMGTFPCFMTRSSNVTTISSTIPDLLTATERPYSINCLVIGRYLRYGLERSQTGLSEIGKVLPGQFLKFSPFGVTISYPWTPLDYCNRGEDIDPSRASVTLRQLLCSTTQALAAPHKKILLKIGGLDSSLLLSCLSHTRSADDLSAITIYQDCPMGDERRFVREATGKVSIPLLEYPETASRLDEDQLSAAPLTALPLYYAQHGQFEKRLTEIIEEENFDAIFTGHAGDEILYAAATSYGAMDYLYNRLFPIKLFSFMMEAARMQNRSVWSLFPEILRSRFNKQPWSFYAQHGHGKSRLLDPDLQDQIRPGKDTHPWLTREASIPPGKYYHLFPLTKGLYALEFMGHAEDPPPVIMPYLSQPFVEYCLSLPSWRLTSDGMDRGLARLAFKNFVPDNILKRRSKFSSAYYLRTLVELNFDFIRDTLMDGLLVQNRIIHRQSLEQLLSKEQDTDTRDQAWLINFLNTEIWARKWENMGRFR